MKFLALEKDVPGVSAEAYAPHLKDEARTVLAMYEEGIIREVYFTRDTHEAVIILECATLVEAHAALSRLPLVHHGLLAFSVAELTPYTGFSRLLE